MHRKFWTKVRQKSTKSLEQSTLTKENNMFEAQKTSWSSDLQRELQSQRIKKYLESDKVREKIGQQSKGFCQAS